MKQVGGVEANPNISRYTIPSETRPSILADTGILHRPLLLEAIEIVNLHRCLETSMSLLGYLNAKLGLLLLLQVFTVLGDSMRILSQVLPYMMLNAPTIYFANSLTMVNIS
ncbi:hypothetical protein LWI28_027530 [Acer negundo]|uniref:Uncharacterized protein n=1 Tax=Acer negundo TaxID=4023 RepID=A0AAD5IL11_ACENE|nr:hypothetical protein LWI28_027530 [Acer negundo]